MTMTTMRTDATAPTSDVPTEVIETLLLHTLEIRLLTLTGPGGSSKTRLARQAAWTLTAQVADGAAFVAR